MRVRASAARAKLAWCVAMHVGCGGAAQTNVVDAPGETPTEERPWRVADMLGELDIQGTRPATRQLVWVLAQLEADAAPMTSTEAEARFAPAFLDVLPVQALVSTFAQLREPMRGIVLTELVASQDGTRLTAVARLPEGSHLRIQLATQSAEPWRMESLLFQPAPDLDRSAPTTWEAWEEMATDVATHHTMLFADITDGDCQIVRALHPDEALPIGSTFKLWVLAAVHAAVEAGTLTWETELPIVDAWRTLPSGITQNEPPGTSLTVRTLAERMISISDNTATDHLIHAVGREQVEATMEHIGVSVLTRNLPLLTTSELFALKAYDADALRVEWIAADTAHRRTLLQSLAPVESVAALGPWVSPRAVDEVEWFASANDLCNVWLHLANAAEASQDETLFELVSINPGVRLDPGRWPFVGYKGGSEPGVLSLSWMLQESEGRTYVYVVGFADPNRGIDEAFAVTLAAWGAALLPLDLVPLED